MVLEGVRTSARQRGLFAQGRSAAEMRAVGLSAAWARPTFPSVTRTLASKHLIQPDGFGHAVDLVPFPLDWEGPWRFPRFDAIADAMFRAAAALETPIRWGADWDRDGRPRERGESDSPHFELAPEALS